MKTTNQFLDALAHKHGGASDYRLAQILGVSKESVSRWRNGRGFIGDDVCVKIAHELGLDPGYVAACAHAERAKSAETKRMWLQLAGKAAAIALALLALVQFASGGNFDLVQADQAGMWLAALAGNTHYAHQWLIAGAWAAVAAALVAWGLSTYRGRPPARPSAF